MGRLIDVSELHNTVMINKSEWGIFATPIDRLVESLVMQVSTVEAIPKADYENRLKADMVAMLKELQLEIEEIKPLEPIDDEDWQCGCFHGLELMQDKCLRLIQEKINNLKENE